MFVHKLDTKWHFPIFQMLNILGVRRSRNTYVWDTLQVINQAGSADYLSGPKRQIYLNIAGGMLWGLAKPWSDWRAGHRSSCHGAGLVYQDKQCC